MLWLLRDTDRNIINQDDVVQTMREAGASAITLRKSADAPLQTLVSDFQNHEIVFAVQWCGYGEHRARAGDRSQAAGDGAADAVWLAAGPNDHGRWIATTKNRETGRAVSLYPLVHGQPYIEAYADDFRPLCDGVDFRDNFTIPTGDRLKKLFELAVQTFNGARGRSMMEFLPASFDEGSRWC